MKIILYTWISNYRYILQDLLEHNATVLEIVVHYFKLPIYYMEVISTYKLLIFVHYSYIVCELIEFG